MPIYAYRCDACGFEKDVLQKLSDAPLTACPSCGKDAFKKQLTAAGFQLKGSGWYVTDFRDNKKTTGKDASKEPAKESSKEKEAATSKDSSKSTDAAAPAPTPAPASSPASAPAPSPTGSK
jgi:putative FmdB family regulatory protein